MRVGDTRSTREPLAAFRLASLDLRREFDRIDDATVAGTTAEVARDRELNLVPRRAGALVEQRRRRHQHARRAEAALAAAHAVEAVEQRIDVRRTREHLHGPHLFAVRLEREREAGEHGRAVDDDRTRAAVALVAALLGADEVEVVAQRLEQRATRRHRERHAAAPDVHRHRHEPLARLARILRHDLAVGPERAPLAARARARDRMSGRYRKRESARGQLAVLDEPRLHDPLPRADEPEVVDEQLDRRVSHALAHAEPRAVHAIGPQHRRPHRVR
jgi:hypothetical protein